MENNQLIKARYYQDRAIKMRTMAAHEDNLEVRKAYISIAEGYEKLWLEVMVLAEQPDDQVVLEFKR
jgi:uncharacterized membrane protein